MLTGGGGYTKHGVNVLLSGTSAAADNLALPQNSRQENYGGCVQKNWHSLDLSLYSLLRGHGLISVRSGAVAAALVARSLSVVGRSRLGLGLEQGVVALDLAEAEDEEGADDEEPVHVVRDDGAVGGRVGPAQDGVEETPSAAAVDLGAAALLFWGVRVSKRCFLLCVTGEDRGWDA